jgi:hypothetical protein
MFGMKSTSPVPGRCWSATLFDVSCWVLYGAKEFFLPFIVELLCCAYIKVYFETVMYLRCLIACFSIPEARVQSQASRMAFVMDKLELAIFSIITCFSPVSYYSTNSPYSSFIRSRYNTHASDRSNKIRLTLLLQLKNVNWRIVWEEALYNDFNL